MKSDTFIAYITPAILTYKIPPSLFLPSFKFGLKKGPAAGEAVTACKTTHGSLSYLMTWFKRCGGDAGAGLGGSFSAGGRTARQMVAVAMTHVLGLQVEAQMLLKSGSR